LHPLESAALSRRTPQAEMAFSRSRLKTSPAAPLAFHFLVTLFDKAFALAILAFHFRFACVLLHVLSKSNTDC
jgi:hypothetical protein